MKTNTAPSVFLGIDVGKTDLFCHLLLPSEPASAKFDNNREGIVELVSWLSKHGQAKGLAACLEQTGHYGRAVASALFELGINALYLVNPRQIKAFANQRLRRNKSDTADAASIVILHGISIVRDYPLASFTDSIFLVTSLTVPVWGRVRSNFFTRTSIFIASGNSNPVQLVVYPARGYQ
ncbi:MAG: IS110 family transposase [Verrucomicrobiales bacterium]